MADKVINTTTLNYFKTKLDQIYATDAELQAVADDLDSLESTVDGIVSTGGEANVLEAVKINGNAQTITNKAVDISVGTGTANGTIAIAGSDVAVKGLGSAAYTASTAYDASGAATQALNDAKSYADGLASNYDASGAAAAVLGTSSDSASTMTVYGVKAAVDALSSSVGGDVATQISTAIGGLDSSASATNGSVLTGITITDGKITAKTEKVLGTAASANTTDFDASGAASEVLGESGDAAGTATVYGALASISALETKVGNTNVSTQISSAIGELDSSTAATNGSVLTGITITDGKITAKTEKALGTAATANTTDFDASGAASAVLGTSSDTAGAATVYGALASISALETKVGNTNVSTQITNAVQALDSSATAASNKALSGVTITDGKITASTEIAIPTDNASLTNGAGYQTAAQVTSAITSYGYQTASDVSSAIADAVADITSFEYQVVQTLPATGEAGVVYLISNSGSGTNIYDEYIYVNNAFEKIGTTEVDLSGYWNDTDYTLATTTDIDNMFT